MNVGAESRQTARAGAAEAGGDLVQDLGSNQRRRDFKERCVWQCWWGACRKQNLGTMRPTDSGAGQVDRVPEEGQGLGVLQGTEGKPSKETDVRGGGEVGEPRRSTRNAHESDLGHCRAVASSHPPLTPSQASPCLRLQEGEQRWGGKGSDPIGSPPPPGLVQPLLETP